MTLHCIYRHIFRISNRKVRLWNLACDIAVEHVIDGLPYGCVRMRIPAVRDLCYRKISEYTSILNVDLIYKYLENNPMDEDTLKAWENEFLVDDHTYWYREDKNSRSNMKNEQKWDDISRKMQTSMETIEKGIGHDDKNLYDSIQIENRKRYDYRDFLRKFAVYREEMHIDPDEFDYNFYTYGLSHYGNMPLIEPVEQREVRRIQDFVIVIDTSESTSGELVKAFLKETFGLLKTGESFFAKCNIAVMQCDDAVRDLTFLHSTDELDRFAACLTLTGGGGTDFRPAFAKIEELRRDGTLRDLQGVLYFTDGKGTYPTRRPPYETAFLFLETGTPPPDTPPWAMRLVLSPEEFLPDPVPKTPEIDWQENEAEDLPEL